MVSPGLPLIAPEDDSKERKQDPPKPVELISFYSDKTPFEGTQVLPDGHGKEFVALLRDSKIQHQSLSVEFLKIHSWFQWLQNSIGAASLSVTDTGGVLGFELGLKPSTTTATSPIFRFTSAGFSTALGVPPSSYIPGDVSGLSSNGETLIFGLDPLPGSPELEMTLPEVFAFAGLHGLVNVLPLLDDIKLPLDRQLNPATTLGNTPVHASRNAIWFEPKNSYKTVIRLQFTVPLDKIHEFFTKHLKGAEGTSHTLGITAAYVVVKKTLREMRWQADRSRFSMEMNVTLVAKFKIRLTTNASIDFSAALTFNHSSFNFDLVPQGTETFKKVLIWLATIAEIKDFEPQLETVTDALGIKGFDITRISLTFATHPPKLLYLRLELRVVHQDAVFLFSYTWSRGGGKLKAELWPSEYTPRWIL